MKKRWYVVLQFFLYSPAYVLGFCFSMYMKAMDHVIKAPQKISCITVLEDEAC